MNAKLFRITLLAASLSTLSVSYAADTENCLDDHAATARQLLAERFGVPLDSIRVSQAEHVTWPNGAAGCPRQGMAYTQAMIPGYRIVLTRANRDYHYHGREGAAPFYCARPGPKSGWIQDR